MHTATKRGYEVEELKDILADYCSYFPEYNLKELLADNYFVLTPNTQNPYKQMYTDN